MPIFVCKRAHLDLSKSGIFNIKPCFGDLLEERSLCLCLDNLSKSDFIDMLGIRLFSNPTVTRRENGEGMVQFVKNITDRWKSGKFMPLLDRTQSVNVYILTKLWPSFLEEKPNRVCSECHHMPRTEYFFLASEIRFSVKNTVVRLKI